MLCSIFFVLGMLVGRNQGKQIAEMAYAEEAASKPVAQNGGDEFPLEFDSQTTEEKPDLKPQPAPPETAAPAAGSGWSVDLGLLGALRAADRQAQAARCQAKASGDQGPPAEAKAPASGTAKPTASPRFQKTVLLQITSTKNEKQASEELKRVESKGFKREDIEGHAEKRALAPRLS